MGPLSSAPSSWADEITTLSDNNDPTTLNNTGGFKLYLGSGKDAMNLQKIRMHGVRYILNVADDIPNFHESNRQSGLIYKNLQVGDFGSDIGISRVFDEAIAFVKDAMTMPSSLRTVSNASPTSPSSAATHHTTPTAHQPSPPREDIHTNTPEIDSSAMTPHLLPTVESTTTTTHQETVARTQVTQI